MKVKLLLLLLFVKSVVGRGTDDVLGLIEEAGYKGEAHEVVTEDGYILKLHHIPPATESRKNFPVFIQHGLFATSCDFIITGPKIALAYLLADHGYDVWLGNARGNKHSTLHKKFPSNSKQYWNFSWHEIGYYDLPAMINFVLNHTKASKTFYVGHSQGTTVFTVMMTTRPEYNAKIAQAHLLAPAVFISNSPHPLARLLGSQVNSGLLNGYTYLEFGKIWDLGKELSKVFCSDQQRNSLALCEGIVFGIVGANRKEIEISPHIMEQLPYHISPRISVKQVEHFSQMVFSGKFRQFDYRWQNIARYNSTTPPEYELSNVVVPVYLYHAEEDLLISRIDVERLKSNLPVVKSLRMISNWNHIDIAYGRNARKVLYNDILASFESVNVTEAIAIA